ncbi:MAG: hypothetical protein RLZZ387_2225 [Chloroflexota bacterium]
MQNETRPTPKAPRWITTDAGQWAWDQLDAWRDRAVTALSVRDRSELLAEAEELRDEGQAATV